METMKNLNSNIQNYFNKSQSGFTLVELLVVMAVIGVLASIVLASLRDADTRARYAVVQSEMRNLVQAIVVAQGESNSTLYQMTGTYCSACSCFGVDARDIPATHQCFIDQTNTLNDIKNANRGLIGLPDELRDPWGSPYLFDENEGEAAYGFCGDDNLISLGPDGVIDYLSGNTDDFRVSVPNHSAACN